VRTIEVSTPDAALVPLDSGAVSRMRGFGDFSSVTKVYSFPAKVSADAALTDSVVYGVDSDYTAVVIPQKLAGEFPRALRSDDVVIGKSLLQPLNIRSAQEAIGRRVQLAVTVPDVQSPTKASKTIVQNYSIRGVIEAGAGTDVYIGQQAFEQAGLRTYEQVKLVAKNQSSVGGIRKQIEALGFSTTSPIDTLEQINQLFTFFNIILAGFGSIGMLIAVLGMLNTLTISLLERTQEIGLIVSLGGTETDIKKLFVSESLILSVMGGVLGLVMAFGGGKLIDFGLNNLAARQGLTEQFSMFSLPIALVSVVVVFMVVVGLAVVYVPARRAARINPITALRRE
jgi:putative ABC transport system permease protein